MARKKDSPQKAALREMMNSYLKENNVQVKDGTDVNAIMRDMMSVILEGALDEELDEELGYTKYDYRWIFLVIARASLSHRSLKNIRIRLPRTWKKRLFPCTQKA